MEIVDFWEKNGGRRQRGESTYRLVDDRGLGVQFVIRKVRFAVADFFGLAAEFRSRVRKP